jgi:miniconductance mechanosensitive channel
MLLDVLLRTGIAIVLTVGAYLLTRILLARFALPMLHRHRAQWAMLVEHSRLPRLTALLAASVALYLGAGLLTEGYPRYTELLRLIDGAIGLGIMVLMVTTVTSIALTLYEQMPLSKEVPLRGFAQLVQTIVLLIGGLIIIGTFLGVPAVYSFAALAALFTALGFVFQDPIMGFVAGIQLAANKMVAIGDWIEVPQYGANGTVQEILMSTVKIQNWDNTVTTVPAHALISDSFKNWRFMYASGGRRLQRQLLLDIYAVRPATPALLAQFPTLTSVQEQIAAGQLATAGILIDDAITQPTNLGLYRVYLTDYLCHHSRVNQQMMRMVRQLQAEEDGLPLEITVYLLDTGWPEFETSASSIFEHILATLPQFGLRPFQRSISTNIDATALGEPSPVAVAQAKPTRR